MPRTRKETWPITARGRAFSEEEMRLFDQAVSLIDLHGKETAVDSGRTRVNLATADIGPYCITRVTIADGWNRKVEIGVILEGKKVLQASREQWRRPKRRRELAILCEVPTFIRGDWEAALLLLH